MIMKQAIAVNMRVIAMAVSLALAMAPGRSIAQEQEPPSDQEQATAARQQEQRDTTQAEVQAEENASELEAVEPPRALLTGRIWMKDGITPVPKAEILMVGAVDGEIYRARADRGGRFKLRLPVGEYSLQINRTMRIYEAPAGYRVPSKGRVEIDFLLLPDFEEEAADGVAARHSLRRGPDPIPSSPAVVGSVVDMVHSSSPRRMSRWAEALGFIGSILAVALAGH